MNILKNKIIIKNKFLPVTQHNSGISKNGDVTPARRSLFDGLLTNKG